MEQINLLKQFKYKTTDRTEPLKKLKIIIIIIILVVVIVSSRNGATDIGVNLDGKGAQTLHLPLPSFLKSGGGGSSLKVQKFPNGSA